MVTLTKEMEQYIEHEVRLRVHDAKFQSLENAIKHLESRMDESIRHLDNKLSWTLSLVVGSIILPVVLHLFKVN